MSPRDNPETSHGLVQLARRELLRQSSGDDASALERLVQAQRDVVESVPRRPSYYYWVPALAAAACVGWLSLRAPEPVALTFAVSQLGETAAGARQTAYVFADGTRVSLAAQAELKVLSVNPQAPRLQLVKGGAEVKVIHRPGTQWRLEAGPFELRVVGTAFGLQWDPSSQEFAMQMHEGKVELSGPVLDTVLSLHAGQRITISAATRRMTIRSAADAAEAVGNQAAARALSSGRAAISAPVSAPLTLPGSPTPSAGVAAPTPPRAWHALVARGRFAQVLNEAEAMPVDACLARCAAGELRALGDAARYSGRRQLAEQALLAIRQRFAGSSDSAVAAFLLARSYEAARKADLSRLWYARYLAEAPRGEFALDASAGKARLDAAR